MWSYIPYMTGEAMSRPLNPRDPSRLTSDIITFLWGGFGGFRGYRGKIVYALTIR
jgi:hypothetical protein